MPAVGFKGKAQRFPCGVKGQSPYMVRSGVATRVTLFRKKEKLACMCKCYICVIICVKGGIIICNILNRLKILERMVCRVTIRGV